MKAAASADLAAALAAPVRAARQGADRPSGKANPETASFDSVLNDVQEAAGNGPAAEPGVDVGPGAGNEPAYAAGTPAAGRFRKAAVPVAAPATDGGGPALPMPDGDTSGVLPAGNAASNAVAADGGAGSGPQTEAGSPAAAGIALTLLAPAQLPSAQFPHAQFVAAPAVAPASGRIEGSRIAAPASASLTAVPAVVSPARVRQEHAPASTDAGTVAGALAMAAPLTGNPVTVASPASTVATAAAWPALTTASTQAPAATLGLTGPAVAASAVAATAAAASISTPTDGQPVSGQVSAPAAAPVSVPVTTPATSSATAAASSPAMPAAGGVATTSVSGSAPVFGTSPELAAGAAQTLSATERAAVQAGPLGVTAPTTGPAGSEADETAAAPSAPGQAMPAQAMPVPAVQAGAGATTAATAAVTAAAATIAAGPNALTAPVPAVPNSGEAPSDPDSGAPAAAAALPPSAGNTAPQTVPPTVPQSAAQAAFQPSAQQAPQTAVALQPQLAKPLFTLVGAAHGQHVMTLKVSPEDLGPLTVRAHIDGAGVRIELFAPGEAGREAVRGILPELRKELHNAGFGASLDLSDHSGPGGPSQNAGNTGAGQDRAGPGGQFGAGRDPGGNGSGPDGRNGPPEPRPGHRWDALADDQALRTARILNGPQTTLDILV
ncbi:flagellar hook-length control protein FliK [Arthrobacter sp. NPDC058130]|uniref:flagellar hook-length control protein FliK n=1 Tax=Arthrobacter sp. NPDC058130 TaxID=3346353 RepID=UPI0036E5B96B